VLHVYKDGRSNMNDFGDACSVPGAGDEDGAIHCESRPRDVRLCDVCRQCSARFGVADENLDGAWSRLMCRQCSNSYIPQNVRLSFPKVPVTSSATIYVRNSWLFQATLLARDHMLLFLSTSLSLSLSFSLSLTHTQMHMITVYVCMYIYPILPP